MPLPVPKSRMRSGVQRLGHEQLRLGARNEAAAVHAEGAPVEVPLADEVLDGNSRQPQLPELVESRRDPFGKWLPGLERERARMAECVREQDPGVPERGLGIAATGEFGGVLEDFADGHG
jgi:hypothetical protein